MTKKTPQIQISMGSLGFFDEIIFLLACNPDDCEL
jgi:hypothetical protein